jgi:hypothetical protein
MFISFLYMFRATVWPSSAEIIVSMQHLVFVTAWMTVWYAGCTLHTRQPSAQNNKYQVSHKYSCFSWWCAHSCPKHVEKRNKQIKKKFVHQVGVIYKTGTYATFLALKFFLISSSWELLFFNNFCILCENAMEEQYRIILTIL